MGRENHLGIFRTCRREKLSDLWCMPMSPHTIGLDTFIAFRVVKWQFRTPSRTGNTAFRINNDSLQRYNSVLHQWRER